MGCNVPVAVMLSALQAGSLVLGGSNSDLRRVATMLHLVASQWWGVAWERELTWLVNVLFCTKPETRQVPKGGTQYITS